MRTDWSDDHAGDTGVDHAGSRCQGVGCAASRSGDDDACIETSGRVIDEWRK